MSEMISGGASKGPDVVGDGFDVTIVHETMADVRCWVGVHTLGLPKVTLRLDLDAPVVLSGSVCCASTSNIMLSTVIGAQLLTEIFDPRTSDPNSMVVGDSILPS